MSSLADYVRGSSSDQQPPLFVRYRGDLILLPPDGCKFMCRHCLVKGIPWEKAVFAATSFGQQHGDRCKYYARTVGDEEEEPTPHPMNEISLQDLSRTAADVKNALTGDKKRPTPSEDVPVHPQSLDGSDAKLFAADETEKDAPNNNTKENIMADTIVSNAATKTETLIKVKALAKTTGQTVAMSVKTSPSAAGKKTMVAHNSHSEKHPTAKQSETIEAAENATKIDTAPEVAENARTTMAEILHHRQTSARPESTMDAFENKSGGNPCIPFSRDLQTTNAVEKEEHRIFDAASPQYDRKAALTSTNGYTQFQQWWQHEVVNRRRQSAEDDAIHFRPKSVTQLQEHYDYVQQVARQADQFTSINETENARRRMSRTVYHSRPAVEGRVTTTPATPIVCPAVIPGTAQFVPVGAAMMQPQIFPHMFRMAPAGAAFNINAAPWIMLPPQQQQNIGPPSPKRARVQHNWRMLCRCCGWPKKDHNRVAKRYQYNDNCALTICGICNQRKVEHVLRARDNGEPIGPQYKYMGKNCIFSN